jgi:ADP-ribose pyrophosphatase YjhB (NUDIX family)
LKYCSDCGSSKIEFKTPQGDNIKRYCCPDCNNVFYTNPNMIVGAICIRDNKILLAKRNIHPRKGLWTLPAGFMENAETLKVGALRETMEETMSEASVVMPYTMFSLPHINQVHLFYLADLLDDNFGPTSESMEVKLFSEGS